MQTIYIYLSEAGWAWFAFVVMTAGVAFALGWRPGKVRPERSGFEVISSKTSEADHRHEQ